MSIIPLPMHTESGIFLAIDLLFPAPRLRRVSYFSVESRYRRDKIYVIMRPGETPTNRTTMVIFERIPRQPDITQLYLRRSLIFN